MGWRSLLMLAAACWAGGALGAHRVEAAFAHVINFHGGEVSYWGTLAPDTQLNVYGGEIYGYLTAGYRDADRNNIEVNVGGGAMSALNAERGVSVNVTGGVLRNVHAYLGGLTMDVSGGQVDSLDVGYDSIVSVSGGYVGSASVRNALLRMTGAADVGDLRLTGGMANISGGAIRSYVITYESIVNMSGGSLGSRVILQKSTANLFGGSTGQLFAGDENRVHVYGGDFRLNGVPIDLFRFPGISRQIDLPEDSVLTGVLEDGTPLVLAQQGSGRWRDFLGDGVLTLHTSRIPDVTTGTIQSPGAVVPQGVRAEQRLVLSDGGLAPANFVAAAGSEVDVRGGSLGDGLKALGAKITMNAGTIGSLARLYEGTVVTMTGGRIDSVLIVGRGSVVNVSGGVVGGGPEIEAGGVLNFAGGAIEGSLQAQQGSQFNLQGGEFRLNGVPLAAANQPGAVTPLNLPSGATLSGTLADGSSFALTNEGLSSYDLASGTLTLESAPLPPRGPHTANVPNDPAPRGLRAGQSVSVSDGGALPDHFTAGWGTTVRIDGGSVGDYFKAAGSHVTITSGNVGGLFSAYYGSVINISGGTVGSLLASRGSVVNVSGGAFDGSVNVGAGAVLNVTGGKIPLYSTAYDGSVVNVSDGSIGDDFRAHGATIVMTGGQLGNRFGGWSPGASVTIAGGTVGDEFANSGRTVLRGGDFRLNGAPIVGLLEYNTPTSVDVPVGWTLSGTLADGTPFAFSPDDGDNVSGGAGYFVQAWPTMGAGPAILALPGADAPAGVRSGQMLQVNGGGALGDNFNAGWGSAVTINGGTVGRNFEAVGANVTMMGGTLGGGFDAMYGSRVSIAGGQIGQPNPEATWDPNPFTAHAGSVVTISGGDFLSKFRAEAGSEVHLVGTDFLLNNAPIDGLTLGQTVEIFQRGDRPYDGGQILSGALADGSSFRFILDGVSLPFDLDEYFFSPDATLTVTMALTADFDGDAAVTASDLARWRPSFGGDVGADSDGDGDTDGVDFLAWQRQLGRGVTSGVAAPEPTGAALLVVGAVVATAFSGRRRESGAQMGYECASKYGAQREAISARVAASRSAYSLVL